MSAETLRRAAAEMRRCARMAEPGRWKLWGMSVMADPEGTSNVADAIDVARTATPSTSDRILHTGNAQHIASWHPAVALAVADWLDREAALHDALAATGDLLNAASKGLGLGEVRIQFTADADQMAASTMPQALAVALAYLGETP